MTSWRPLGISSCPGDGFSVLENCRKVGLGNSSFQKGRPQKPQKKTGSSPGCHHVFFSEAMLTLVTLTLVTLDLQGVYVLHPRKLLFVPGTSKT